MLKFDSHTGQVTPSLSETNICSPLGVGSTMGHSAHTVLALTSGSIVPTLPKCHKHEVQTSAFGYPSVILDTVPGHETDGMIELSVPVHECPECGDEVSPTPTSDPSEPWILYPCCQYECSCCYAFGTLCSNCSKVEDCCECSYCHSCHEPVDETCDNCETCEHCCNCVSCTNCGTKDSYGEDICGDCDQCSGCCSCNRHDECDCGECHGSSSSSLTPGWAKRGWSVPISNRDAGTQFTQDYAKYIDPAQGMSDFYLLDYISAVLAPKVRYGANNGLRAGTVLLRTAEHLQGALVSVLDDAFRTYGFFAIGGEVRHHPSVRNVNPTHGRENMWTYWEDMGDEYGRSELLQDALALFRDPVWNGGYGGEAWAVCTDIVLMREKGDLDAKTFVDRCFALQHNGGSFLDKVYWTPAWDNRDGMGVSYMKQIGNAHASETIGFEALLRTASNAVKGLLSDLLADAYLSSLVPAGDRTNLSAALSYYGPTRTGDEVADSSDLYEYDPETATWVVAAPEPEVDTFATVAASAPVSTTGFAPNATYKSKMGNHTMVFGADTSIATFSSGSDKTPVGVGTSYPKYLMEQSVDDWTLVSLESASIPSSTEMDCVPSGSLLAMCDDTAPDGVYVCTAAKGHSGHHIATYGHGHLCPIEPWPNAADATVSVVSDSPGAPFAGAGMPFCMESSTSSPYYVCTAAPGHSGSHAAYYGDGTPCAGTPSWPNTADMSASSAKENA